MADAHQTERVTQLIDLVRHFRLEDLLTDRYHSRDFSFYRADYLLVRVKLFALLFGLATPLWIPVDFWLLPGESLLPMAWLRAVTGGLFLLLAVFGARSRTPSNIRLSLLFLIGIPAIFYCGSRIILGPQGLDGALIGYAFLPFVLIAGGAIFPLTIAEGVLIMLPVYGAVIAISLRFGELFTLPTMGTLWLMAILSGVALWTQSAQLYMLLGLYRQATRDTLTGLFNRGALFRRMRTELGRAGRSGRPVAALLLDLDHFKGINDQYGHPVGDEVLRYLAEVLEEETREEDLLGRYGGEEFIVVAPETDGEGAANLAERIRHAMAGEPVPTAAGGLAVTLSIGVAVGEPGEGLEELLSRVDEALYQAKEGGRDRVVFARERGPAGTVAAGVAG